MVRVTPLIFVQASSYHGVVRVRARVGVRVRVGVSVWVKVRAKVAPC